MRCFRIGVAVMTFLLAALSAHAQATPAKPEVLANGNLMHSLLAAPVVGEPYSAMVVHSTSRTLANGTTISHHGHHFVARDSEGRVHVEVRMAHGRNGHPDMVMVFVIDPVAHTLTTWVTGVPADRQVASVIRTAAKPNESATPAPRHLSNRPQPIITTETLAPDTLQGIPVSVVRRTTIMPAGRSGNDAPITKTLEIWTSPDLKLVMKEQWDDPRRGERIVKLEDFSRDEPDPALFRPPAGYTVKGVLQSLQELEQQLRGNQD